MISRQASQLFSIEIKVLVKFGDVDDTTFIHRDDCETVQSYSYGYGRSPFDTSVYEAYKGDNRMFDYSLRIRPDGATRKIYEMLDSDTPVTHTFFFNAVFGSDNVMISYDSAMIVKGYVESVNETIVNSELQQNDGTGRNTALNVRILVNSVKHTDGKNFIEITL